MKKLMIRGGHQHNIKRRPTGKIHFSLWACPPLSVTVGIISPDTHRNCSRPVSET
jgi:hypothetical protein